MIGNYREEHLVYYNKICRLLEGLANWHMAIGNTFGPGWLLQILPV